MKYSRVIINSKASLRSLGIVSAKDVMHVAQLSACNHVRDFEASLFDAFDPSEAFERP